MRKTTKLLTLNITDSVNQIRIPDFVPFIKATLPVDHVGIIFHKLDVNW